MTESDEPGRHDPHSSSESDLDRAFDRGLDEAFHASSGPAAEAATAEKAGDRIGRYKLLQEVGQGGMGTVWMAEQQEPVRRQVALKLVKLGMDTREVITRFEAERQALAMMDHPNIAKVLDGGATETGRPFFVMELVRGVPITRFCDDSRLGLQERLELFARVCDAVQHAHLKGVIHRDLKPSNVMVTLYDGVPMPKVIDFGIAKATSAELTQKTMFTRYGAMIGTPEYMAPEQAEMSALDIDTRADVYSLGVLLYELLTGTTPFELQSVLEKGYQELIRTIREDDPVRPSTRVSTLGEKAAAIARNRHADPASLSTRLRGEIDWIVMRAMEKDRRRRYETASGFAEDVRRFLRGEAVQAVPPSAGYKARKFLSRHRRTVAFAAVVLVLVVAGAVGSGLGWWNSHVANRKLAQTNARLEETNAALEQADRDKTAALESERLARLAAEDAQAREARERQNLGMVAKFQEARLVDFRPSLVGADLREGLLAALDGAPTTEDPAAARGSIGAYDYTESIRASMVRHVVDPLIEDVRARFDDQPDVKARLLNASAVQLSQFGELDRSLQLYDEALATLLRAEGSSPVSGLALTIRSSKGGVLMQLDRHADAIALDREIQADLATRGAEPIALAQALELHANVLLHEGRQADALEVYDECEAIYSAASGWFSRSALLVRGVALGLRVELGRVEEAERMAREYLQRYAGHLDPQHPERVNVQRTLGRILVDAGRNEEALPLLQQVVVGDRAANGRHSPQAFLSGIVCLHCLIALDRWDEGEVLLAELRGALEGALGDEVHLRMMLGTVEDRFEARAGGALDDERMRQTLAEAKEQFPSGGPGLVAFLINRARVVHGAGETARAEVLIREAIANSETLEPDHPLRILTLMDLGGVLCDLGRADEAVEILRTATARAREAMGDDHMRTLQALNSLGVTLQRLGRMDEALEVVAELMATQIRTRGAEDPAALFAVANYGTMLQQTGRRQEALEHYERALAGQTRVLGETHPATLATRIHRASVLHQDERNAEALAEMEEVMALVREHVRQPQLHTYAIRVLGMAQFAAGDVEAASASYRELLEVAETAEPGSVAGYLADFANRLLEHGQPAEAEARYDELIALRGEAWAGDERADRYALARVVARALQGDFATHADEVERLATRLDDDAITEPTRRAAVELTLLFYEAWLARVPGAEGVAARLSAWKTRDVALRDR